MPSLDWSQPIILESDKSVWGDWRIEPLEKDFLPPALKKNLESVAFQADHVRALADMIAYGFYTRASGMSEEYLDGDAYDVDLFEHIFLLQSQSNWTDIDTFMTKEYRLTWMNFKNGKANTCE